MDRSLIRAVCNPWLAVWHYRAIQQFLAWVERAGYQDLEDIEPVTVAAYIETLGRQAAPPTVKRQKPLAWAVPGSP
jgi:hypothetical protein